MLKIILQLEVPNQEEAQLTLEHIAVQIGQGDVQGEGWMVEGDEESDDDGADSL